MRATSDRRLRAATLCLVCGLQVMALRGPCFSARRLDGRARGSSQAAYSCAITCALDGDGRPSLNRQGKARDAHQVTCRDTFTTDEAVHTRAEAKELTRELRQKEAAVEGHSEDDEPLLKLLWRALYKEVFVPIVVLPAVLTKQGTKTVRRLSKDYRDAVTMQRRTGWTTRTLLRTNILEEIALAWYDDCYNQQMRFLPTDLPSALIDRRVKRVELDPKAALKYIEEFDVVSVLGEGATGQVLCVKKSLAQEGDEFYAVKVLNKQKLQEMVYNDHNLLKNVETEIQIMRRMGRHPNILALYEVMGEPARSTAPFCLLCCECLAGFSCGCVLHGLQVA